MALPTNPPPAPAVAAASGGALGAGAYLWAVTYLGNYGETGLGTPIGLTATANQLCNLTAIPTGPAGTVSRNVYRTKVGGSVFFFATNIGDNTSTTWSDTLADTALGGTPTQFFLSQGDIQGMFLMFDDQKPIASANYGVLNIGPGAWDGTTTGFFAGSAQGTGLAMDFQTGYTGNYIDFQLNGVSKISATMDGMLVANANTASHFGGVATVQKAGTPSDADFAAPVNGLLVVDSTGNKIWARVGGAWKGVAIA